MKFSCFVTLAGAVTSCLSTPVADGPVGRSVPAIGTSRAGTPSSEGTHDGFFYSWWTDGGADAYYKNTEGGSYEVQWSGQGNFVGGKGWKPGVHDRKIKYSGSFNTSGNGYLAVYGWTRNPFIEYYILESYGTYNPLTNAVKKGSVTCNGANYDITQVYHNGWTPETTYRTFFSVQNPKRAPGDKVSGTVDTACHFDAWKAVGMQIGSEHTYQIVATEGYYSSGNSTVTVSLA